MNLSAGFLRYEQAFGELETAIQSAFDGRRTSQWNELSNLDLLDSMSEFTVNHKAYTTSIHLKKNEHEFDLMSKINAKITERDNLALEAQIHSNIKSLNEELPTQHFDALVLPDFDAAVKIAENVPILKSMIRNSDQERRLFLIAVERYLREQLQFKLDDVRKRVAASQSELKTMSDDKKRSDQGFRDLVKVIKEKLEQHEDDLDRKVPLSDASSGSVSGIPGSTVAAHRNQQSTTSTVVHHQGRAEYDREKNDKRGGGRGNRNGHRR